MTMAVAVELLTGRYVATRFNDRDRPEWPPHPGRLFSAAVAAWAEADEPDPREREALLWWERQGAPTISCSWDGDPEDEGPPDVTVGTRATVTHYVPVNDARIVARDTSATYRKLGEALDEARVASAGGDDAAARRATKTVERLRVKAVDEARRVTAGGVAARDGLKILPELRGRQPRTYPTVIPADQRVTFVWPGADRGAAHVEVLDTLLGRIGRLGHSSSLVSVFVTDDVPEPVLVPDEPGEIAVRVASEGQLAALTAAYGRHQGCEPRTLPAAVVGYRPARTGAPAPPSSVFSTDWVVLAPRGRSRFFIRDVLGLARAVRGALMCWSAQPVPEVISGHRPGTGTPGTAPSERAHLAVVPLPFVGRPHADGSVKGVALVLPRGASSDEREAVIAAAGRWLAADGGQGRLLLGRRGATTFERVATLDAPWSATARRWTGPSRRWLTATPIALDRHPGDLADHDPARRALSEDAARRSIAKACHHIGLPSPVSVVLRDIGAVGSRPTRVFPHYAVQGGRLRRLLVHAEVVFAERVRGPVLLGAGRYLGYGLCVPVAGPAGGDGQTEAR